MKEPAVEKEELSYLPGVNDGARKNDAVFMWKFRLLPSGFFEAG